KSESQYWTGLPGRCSPSRTLKRQNDCSPGFIRYSAECVATQRFCASSVVAPITGCSRIPSPARWTVFAAPQGLGPPNLEPELPKSKEPSHAAASSTAASAVLKGAPSARLRRQMSRPVTPADRPSYPAEGATPDHRESPDRLGWW